MSTQKQYRSLIKLCIKYALPSMFGMLFIGLQTIIDGLFVGNIVGENALASLNIVLPYIQVVMAVSMVVGVGAQTLIGIKLGENKEKEAGALFMTAFYSTLGLALIIALCGVFFPYPIVRLLGASDTLATDSANYLRTISYFVPFISVWLLLDYVLRLMGKVKLVFIAMAVSAGLNILLDFLFVKMFAFGIVGAAFATSVAYASACVICLIPYLRRRQTIVFRRVKFDIRAVGRMLYNGSSEGVNSLASAVVILIFNVMLMKYAGEAGVTAFTAILYIMQIGSALLLGISDGVRPIVSLYYGAGETQKLKGVYIIALVMAGIIGLLILAAMLIFARPLVRMFVSTETVIAMTVTGVHISAFAFLFSGFNVVTSGFYTAIDYARESVIVSIMRGLVFIMIAVFTLPLLFGINGIWASQVVSEAATALVVAGMFLVQQKKIFRCSVTDLNHQTQTAD